MGVYKDMHPLLRNSDATIAFVKRVNKLIDVMNARTPLTAIKKDSDTIKVK